MPFINKLDEFLNGSESDVAIIGRKIERILKLVLVTMMKIWIFSFLIGAAQFWQYYLSVNDLRMKAVADWKADNPTQAQLAELFIERCIKKDSPEGVYKCGVGIGAGELVRTIQTSDEILKSPAWPLSLIAPVVGHIYY